MSPGSSIAALMLAIVTLSPDAPDADTASLHSRLATLASRREALVRRLAAIEADRQVPLLLRAPVDIQDRAGNTIAFISRKGLGRGLTLFNERKQSVAGFDGSALFVLAGKGGGWVTMNYAADGPSLSLVDGARKVALVGDGFVSFGPTGKAMTTQLTSAYEAGFLSIGDAGGNVMVEAGMLSTRKNTGVVRVAPYIPREELLLPVTPYRIPYFIWGYRPK